MDLMIWVLIAGIIMVVGAVILSIYFLQQSKVPILSKILIFGFIIVLGFSGFAAIGAFLLMMGIGALFDLGETIMFLIGSLFSVGGTAVGLGVAWRYQNKKTKECLNDPECDILD